MLSKNISYSSPNEVSPGYDSIMHALKQKDADFLIKYSFFHDNNLTLDNYEIVNAMKLLGLESQKEVDKNLAFHNAIYIAII